MSALTQLLKPLEVRHHGVYEHAPPSRWGNRDIYPVIESQRTYTARAFYAYWATAGICISSYTLGSSMIGIGLTAGE